MLGSVSSSATITADFNRAMQATASENRGGESTLGNFVADVQLWAGQTPGAQIALHEPRRPARGPALTRPPDASDPDGNVTYREAADVQPFANPHSLPEMAGFLHGNPAISGAQLQTGCASASIAAATSASASPTHCTGAIRSLSTIAARAIVPAG